MNILLTSAGRRSYLVKYFQEAWKGKGLVHASNLIKDATSLFYADKYLITPHIHDEKYIPFLLDYCKKHEISVIITLFDIDLPVLAENRQKFEDENITILVSDLDVISICNDKWKTNKFISDLGLGFAKTELTIANCVDKLQTKEMAFPLIMKPRWGMGSIGIYTAYTFDDMMALKKIIQEQIRITYLRYESLQTPEEMIMYQEFIEGQEYGLDIINDLDGNYLTTLVKKKLAMRSGETDAATTLNHPELEAIGEKIGTALKHVGILDVDVMEKDGDFYVIEMNARFGGGYPFSHLAGARLPEQIYKWLNNEGTDKSLLTIKHNVTSFKDICPILSPIH